MEHKPLKPVLSLEAQVDLLQSRGLIINDTKQAIKILSNVNYYRLSAYSLGLRKDDVFFTEVSFDQIYQLYNFDTKLRHLLLSAIELIEIKFRTKIAYYLAMEYGAMSYLDVNLFKSNTRHQAFIIEFEREKERQKETAFVKHHMSTYGGIMPVWVAVEICSFGMISKLFSNLKVKYQKNFVQNYLAKPKGFNDYFISWLRCLVDVRNICAHYGRIYNRILSSSPKIPNRFSDADLNLRRIFPLLIVIILLLEDFDTTTSFITNIAALVEAHPAVNLSLIGFPDNWRTVLDKAR